MPGEIPCPHCGQAVVHYTNPTPTVDIIIYHEKKNALVLIERANDPPGLALPGGFIEYNETAEHAAIREAYEETGLVVTLRKLTGVYSDPQRDPRFHTLSIVFAATPLTDAAPVAGDDAAAARYYPLDKLPSDIAFDHPVIIKDFLRFLQPA